MTVGGNVACPKCGKLMITGFACFNCNYSPGPCINTDLVSYKKELRERRENELRRLHRDVFITAMGFNANEAEHFPKDAVKASAAFADEVIRQWGEIERNRDAAIAEALKDE